MRFDSTIPNESDEEDNEDDGYCTACAGTGEGQYDGASCSYCRGKGYVVPKWYIEDSLDEPDDRYCDEEGNLV